MTLTSMHRYRHTDLKEYHPTHNDGTSDCNKVYWSDITNYVNDEYILENKQDEWFLLTAKQGR